MKKGETRGRKKKDPHKLTGKVLYTRITDAENDSLRAVAKKENSTISNLIRIAIQRLVNDYIS